LLVNVEIYIAAIVFTAVLQFYFKASLALSGGTLRASPVVILREAQNVFSGSNSSVDENRR